MFSVVLHINVNLNKSNSLHVGVNMSYLIIKSIFRPAPKNEDEMMVAIFEYIDRWLNFDSKLLLMKLKPNTLIILIYLHVYEL